MQFFRRLYSLVQLHISSEKCTILNTKYRVLVKIIFLFFPVLLSQSVHICPFSFNLRFFFCIDMELKIYHIVRKF
ncbi:hypothetical protein XENTR_v10006102 [Xenopus tropicalis]|nr:hypothetical protein XENTR_v10006102 [Xenopus tropicalis]